MYRIFAVKKCGSLKPKKFYCFLYRFPKAVRFLYSLLYLTQEGMSRPLRPCVIFVEYGHTCHIVAVCRVTMPLLGTNFSLFTWRPEFGAVR